MWTCQVSTCPNKSYFIGQIKRKNNCCQLNNQPGRVTGNMVTCRVNASVSANTEDHLRSVAVCLAGAGGAGHLHLGLGVPGLDPELAELRPRLAVHLRHHHRVELLPHLLQRPVSTHRHPARVPQSLVVVPHLENICASRKNNSDVLKTPCAESLLVRSAPRRSPPSSWRPPHSRPGSRRGLAWGVPHLAACTS